METGDANGAGSSRFIQFGEMRPVGKRIVGIAPRTGVIEVENRFGNAKEQQADPDSGREEHREPRESAEFGATVVVAEFD